MSRSIRLLALAVMSMVLFATISPISTNNAKAETLTWLMKSKYPYRVSISFYSKRRNYSWPGGRKVWVIADNKIHEYTLRCRRGEKICYGAWVRGNKSRYWGVGYKGRRGCRNCCYTCNGGETKVRILSR